MQLCCALIHCPQAVLKRKGKEASLELGPVDLGGGDDHADSGGLAGLQGSLHLVLHLLLGCHPLQHCIKLALWPSVAAAVQASSVVSTEAMTSSMKDCSGHYTGMVGMQGSLERIQ